MSARNFHESDKAAKKPRVARVQWDELTAPAVDRVAKGSDLIVLERQGKPVAAVVSMEALRLIEERQEVLKDTAFPAPVGLRCFVVPQGNTKN